MIGIEYDSASLRDEARQNIGGEEYQKRFHVSQLAKYLRCVHLLKICGDRS